MLGGPGRTGCEGVHFHINMAGVCDCVSFYNIIDHLVYWLVIVYNFCIAHILQWW